MGEIVFRRAHQLDSQHQLFSPENTHPRTIIHTEQVALRNTYVHTYMHIIVINEKSGHEFERTRRDIWEVLGGAKRRGKCILYTQK